ncbi:hypothetical protein [Streptomyces sp. 184]|uniref:hypothetical protein n=1 Tax=Streptomyces sp. 184 TaxID=1827526 RepID=UPI00389287F4
MVTQTRYCAECGAAFTWRSSSPSRRFCGPRCKARWWRGHHRRAAAVVGGAVSLAEKQALRAAAPPNLGTAHDCPHCGQQLTVVNVVVPVEDGPVAAGAEPRTRVFAADRG